jgi:hypothetical protein
MNLNKVTPVSFEKVYWTRSLKLPLLPRVQALGQRSVYHLSILSNYCSMSSRCRSSPCNTRVIGSRPRYFLASKSEPNCPLETTTPFGWLCLMLSHKSASSPTTAKMGTKQSIKETVNYPSPIMSQAPPVTISPSENNASSSGPTLAPSLGPIPKRRSKNMCILLASIHTFLIL